MEVGRRICSGAKFNSRGHIAHLQGFISERDKEVVWVISTILGSLFDSVPAGIRGTFYDWIGYSDSL